MTDIHKQIATYFLSSEEELNNSPLSSAQKNRILRIREIYHFWSAHPRYTDKQIVDEIRSRYKISVSTAYEDIKIIKHCQGVFNENSKGYYRYIFYQRCEEAFELARKKNDAKAFAAVLSCLGKYTHLDKEDPIADTYEQIVPQSFEITTNPEDVGFKAIPNVDKVADKLLKKYISDIDKVNEYDTSDL